MKRFSPMRCAALLVVPAMSLLQGCAMNCKNYRTYDDQLNRWVGASLQDYERTMSVRPTSHMERPQGRLEYSYSTPARRYDGTQANCRTWLEADRDTGKIVSWRYEGDCYLHGYCPR